jgi:hypothetical protein
LKGAAMAGAGLALSGCAVPGAAPAAKIGGKIDYWHHYTSESEMAGLKAGEESFAKKYAGATAASVTIPNADFMAKFTLAVQGGGKPDTTMVAAARVPDMVAMGGLRFLSINLSTIDRERYKKERGGDHMPAVLRNLDYAKQQPLAEQMDMVVLGTGNENHKRDFEEISARFAGSRFTVKYFEVMDRAGYLQIGAKPAQPIGKLCGCDNVGSRPFQHLHITPHAKCVLCCEDYDEKYEVGDLNVESVAEVLVGPKLAQMRRWVYGVEEAPANFICRGCTFALTRQE